MSAYKMSIAEFTEMKDRLRAELSRRNGYGSVTDKISMIDDIPIPMPGSTILVSHGKIMDAFLQIQDLGDLKFCKEGDPIPHSFGPSMFVALEKLEQETMTSASSSCRGACTGLCFGSCTSSCFGCKGSCDGLCQNACVNQCVSTCTGTALV